MMDIYATAHDLDMPINLHLYPSPLSEMETVTKKFPRLKLIMAHPGDFWEAPERFEFVAKHENVYLDISGNGLYRWNMLRHAIDICGSEKLLFGSDFPICSAAMNLQGVLAEHLSDAEFDNVLCKNFKRLVGMD
jgi:predicted TIM-barrel fold metal-dependent hydrolase